MDPYSLNPEETIQTLNQLVDVQELNDELLSKANLLASAGLVEFSERWEVTDAGLAYIYNVNAKKPSGFD